MTVLSGKTDTTEANDEECVAILGGRRGISLKGRQCSQSQQIGAVRQSVSQAGGVRVLEVIEKPIWCLPRGAYLRFIN